MDFFTNNFMGQDNLFIVPHDLETLLKDRLVNFSFQSAGSMALALLKHDVYYYHKAQQTYGTALNTLAQAWQQNDGLERDSTLLTVLLLSFFEMLASFDSSHNSWLAHLSGLGGLLRLRQQKGVQTPFGRRIMLQTQSQVIHDALQTKTAVPDEIAERTSHIREAVPPSIRPAQDVNMLLIRLSRLQARFRTSGLSGDLFIDLATLDRDLSRWEENVPSSWSFSPRANLYDSGVWWDMRRDIYTSRLTAYMWNKVRAARLVIHDLISEQFFMIDAGDFRPIADLWKHEDSLPTTRRLITDTCATIPLCYRPSREARHQAEDTQPVIGCTYWLLWALEIVGSTGKPSAELQDWVLECIDCMHQRTGIAKARSVAQRLRMANRRIAKTRGS